MFRPKQTGMAAAEETLAGVVRAEAPARTGEPADWLPELLRLHLRRVFRVIYRMVGNAADAQDLAQEVFLKAHVRRDQLRDPERALPWLMRIASNTAIDFQRARAVEPLMEEFDAQPRPASILASPEQLAIRDERQRRLQRALQFLSPKERAAIILRDIEGLTGAEVARHLGCSQITVRTHIASARIKLRRILSEAPGKAGQAGA